MNNLNELKKAILLVEQMARRDEVAFEHYAKMGIDVGAVKEEAALYRIAAACMWEKLERLEKGAAEA